MPGGGEFAHRERRQADPIFVILDFLGNTHTHHILSIARSRAVARRRPVRNAAFYPADDRRSKVPTPVRVVRSEEHTSELQSLMRISYAVFCLKKKNNDITRQHNTETHNNTQRQRPAQKQ